MQSDNEYIEGWKVVLGVGCIGFLALSVISFVTGNALWGLGFFSVSFIAGLILGVVLHAEYQERLYQQEQRRLEMLHTKEDRLERERKRRLQVMEQLRAMSDEEFGALLRKIMEQMGYQLPQKSDTPFELHLSKGTDVAFVSWKSWRESLTTERLLEVSEVAEKIGASTTYVVTMGDVPPPAQNLAESRGISIIATGRLVALATDVLEPPEAPDVQEGALRFSEQE